MTSDIAIIGAGIAGITAANRLRSAGYRVTVFEKSRGIGGRMATRRAGARRFDHGAQYFTARHAAFQAQIRSWRETGHVADWSGGGLVGAPAMNAPVKALADGLDVRTGCPVGSLRRRPDGWQIAAAGGNGDVLDERLFAAVLLAVPAPQAAPLADAAGAVLPQLADVVYAPCWALLLSFPARLDGTADRRAVDTGPIAWLARNASKPGRDGIREDFVIHAAPDWSRAHLEWPAEAVADALRDPALALLGTTAEPDYRTAHRWRYALVERSAGVPCLWDGEARIGACGDWAIAPRVEAAFESGLALAEIVIGQMEHPHAA